MYFKKQNCRFGGKANRWSRLLFAMLLPAGLAAQSTEIPIQTYVRQSAVQIATIDPDAGQTADLEVLGAAIGDARIVMLGEQDHGDAPAFLAKTRLIRYLHEKKGFRVLAFESDFFGLNAGWEQALKIPESVLPFLRANIFGVWTGCDACAPLFQYLSDPACRLQVTGFDNQQMLGYANQHLLRQLDSLLRSLEIPLIQSERYEQAVLPAIRELVGAVPSADLAAYNSQQQLLQDLLLQIRQRLPPEDFWIKVVENLIAAHTQFFLRKTNYWASMNARDAQMARNLDWLCRVKYPQEKIIVWAHNYHISKFAGQAKEDFLQAARPMGAVFTADSAHRSNTYILGFTSHSGKAGRLGQKTFNIDKPGKNSLETWFRSDWEYGFVDFVGYNADCLPEQADWFSLKGSVIGKHFNHTAQWSRIFDGVFYLKKMYPCRQVRE